MSKDSSYYTNGYIERKSKGNYDGILNVEGIDLSPIEGAYFKKDGKQYLWIRRRDILEYDDEKMMYFKRKRKPFFETYMEKQNNGVINYKGEFIFLHIKFSIIGIWDYVLGKEKKRLNLYVERLPMGQQTIINKIYDRKRSK